eukprot:2289454-Amphidinium_carterae.1
MVEALVLDPAPCAGCCWLRGQGSLPPFWPLFKAFLVRAIVVIDLDAPFAPRAWWVAVHAVGLDFGWWFSPPVAWTA